MFPVLHEGADRAIDPPTIRHIGFSHFESDECGVSNHWLDLAQRAEPMRGLVGALVSTNDLSLRPHQASTVDDSFTTGKYRFRFLPTPHVPHGWDMGVVFEDTQRTLFCSDLFHQRANLNLYPRTASSSDLEMPCLKVNLDPLQNTYHMRTTSDARWRHSLQGSPECNPPDMFTLRVPFTGVRELRERQQ
jgi:hypothetical protein